MTLSFNNDIFIIHFALIERRVSEKEGILLGKKMRQVTDNIHGTIYLSDLESELISTPYFYRLHDIYQSSTVYMTFPSNRTKRYEHSLGTMALASRILYSSVINADKPTRSLLFSKLKKYSCEIAKAFLNEEDRNGQYLPSCKEAFNNFFDSLESDFDDEYILKCIRKAIQDGEFHNYALDYHQYYPVEGFDHEEDNQIENIFFYRCLLQAVRVVALFHDVGHPPYSHIIEDVLSDLYNQLISETPRTWKKRKVEQLKKCLSPFFSENESEAYKCRRLFSDSSLIEAKAHERIGLSLLNQAINDVVPTEIAKVISSNANKETRFAHILYYITVVEFAFAILVEKDATFKSFHKIVDGDIDADRLDYIVRDSLNSGVDWGVIPYERIINSAKLFYLTKDNSGNEIDEDARPFVVAYPQKISGDIEDLLLVRYKIYARINFHHRCMKTAMALQSAVKELAIDYLSNDDNACISPEISTLWLAHEGKIGNKSIRIIQWNDSWLISVLHKALVNLNIQPDLANKKRNLKEDLEEILLNKKKYYSLLKRGNDNNAFVREVLQKANITKDFVERIKKKEFIKIFSKPEAQVSIDRILIDSQSDALDSIQRLEKVLETFDFKLLWTKIPISIESLFEEKLSCIEGISGKSIFVNYGREKTGLPSHETVYDNIYLYVGNRCFAFDEKVTLLPQIKAIKMHIPWIYVYYVPSEERPDGKDISEVLFDSLTDAVAEKIGMRLRELFPNDYST